MNLAGIHYHSDSKSWRRKAGTSKCFLTTTEGFLDCESVKRTTYFCTWTETPGKPGPQQHIVQEKFKGVFYHSS